MLIASRFMAAGSSPVDHIAASSHARNAVPFKSRRMAIHHPCPLFLARESHGTELFGGTELPNLSSA